jgi:hypothetical protein
VKAYKGLLSEKSGYESELAEFVQEGSSLENIQVRAPVAKIFKRGKVDIPAGAVKIKEYDYVPNKSGKLEAKMKLRYATPAELRRWAVAQAGLEDVNRKLSQTRTNRHVAARDSGAAFDRGGSSGSFADQVKETKPDTQPVNPDNMDLTGMTLEEMKTMLAKLEG